MDNKWTSGGYIGGVCHNLGRMTKIPSLFWRLLFIFGNFVFEPLKYDISLYP